MSSRRCVPGLLLALCFASTEPLRAEDDVAALRQRVVEARQKLIEAKAELESLQVEERLGRPERAVALKRVELADAAPRLNRVVERVETTHKARMEGLKKIAREAEADSSAALLLWEDANQTLLDLQTQRDLVEAARAAEEGKSRLLNLSLFLVLGWGVVVLLVATGLVLHERRTDLRRWWRGGRAAVFAFALTGLRAVALAASGAEEPAKLEAELTRLEQERRDVEADVRKFRNAIDRRRTAHLEAWASLLAVPEGAGETTHGKRLRGWEEEAMDRTRAVLLAGAAARAFTRDAEDVHKQLAREREDLSRAGFHTRVAGFGRTAFRAGLCILFVVVPLGMLLWTRRSLKRRRAADARTCPRCLGRDTLQVRQSPHHNPLYPDGRHLECTACRHEFRQRYRKLPRLCFPTVGVRNSGKTRWLGTTYLQIMNAHTPSRAVVQATPSLAEQQVFGEVLRQILDAEDTDPTVHDVLLPAPLTLHLEDRDTLGKRAALVNLFDFSGEVMNRSIDVDQLRCRALLMDGFVLFLDPTQVHGGMLEQQRDALRRFDEDLRDMRKVEAGKRVPTPVAVCLSRLDLLPESSPFGPVSGDWVHRLRESAARPVKLDVLRERSRLCEEVLPFMFQGWDVGRELRERFGDRVQFFPLSSVGLYDEGLGVRDPAEREFDPFGIFEPLLWLMHMHGYCVLEE